jgi:hypothetical protein
MNGKITMTICPDINDSGLVRLFSHELRHIAQFHRGRKKFGTLTIDPLRPHEAEMDAYEFEEAMVAKLA